VARYRAPGQEIRPRGKAGRAPYPLEHFDLANRVAILGREQGWCGEFVVANTRRWFRDGQPAGSQPNLGDSLAEIGQDPDRIIAKALAAETEAGYRAATDEARSLGIFGSAQLRRRRRAVLGRRPPGRRHLLAPDRRRRVSVPGLAARPSDWARFAEPSTHDNDANRLLPQARGSIQYCKPDPGSQQPYRDPALGPASSRQW
jgi:hypothetical protein